MSQFPIRATKLAYHIPLD